MGKTDFLFARPSFLSGMASVLDVGATFTEYNESKDGTEADKRAIASDWTVTGKDIVGAIKQYENER
jgi:hypothetical protein